MLYTDVLSMWCPLAERSLERLMEAYSNRIEFQVSTPMSCAR